MMATLSSKASVDAQNRVTNRIKQNAKDIRYNLHMFLMPYLFSKDIHIEHLLH